VQRQTFVTISLLTIVFLAMLLSTGCRKEGEHEPSKLISPLESGESLQAVQSKLGWSAGTWDVLNDRRPLSSDKRPPFRVLEISKKDWSHHGVSGELVLLFYNDSLMAAQFYPVDLEQYQSVLESQDQITFSGDGDTKIPPATRVWIGKDAAGRKYIGWIDKTLQAEHDDWVRKYSSGR
jgi:hypothetical protein